MPAAASLTKRRTLAAPLTATVLLGSSLLAPTLLAPAAAADPVPITRIAPDQDPLTHSLGLESLPNGRDLGGYVTTDGRTVRTGVAIRSGSLDKLSPEDSAALQAMGLTTDIDLRTGYERSLQPDRVPAGTYEDWLNVVGDNPANLPMLADMPSLYTSFVTSASARSAFRHSVLDIAYGQGATLFHCTAGKDRTGWLAAILLTAVGVDRDTVYADYMASNHFIGDGMAGAAAPFLDQAGSTFVNRVEAAWLDDSFAAADRVYGGFDGYLREGLGLTDADLDALRARMLN